MTAINPAYRYLRKIRHGFLLSLRTRIKTYEPQRHKGHKGLYILLFPFVYRDSGIVSLWFIKIFKITFQYCLAWRRDAHK